MWYLNRAASAKVLEKLLREDEVFSEYKVVFAAGDGRIGDEDEQAAKNHPQSDIRWVMYCPSARFPHSTAPPRHTTLHPVHRIWFQSTLHLAQNETIHASTCARGTASHTPSRSNPSGRNKNSAS